MHDNVAVLAAPDNEVDSVTSEEALTTSLTDWVNEPKVDDLKQDYEDASSDHDLHVAQVTKWLDNLNVVGSAKHKKIEGRSVIQPMTIRKQAEWRYASLTEPFLSTEDVFNVAPVTWEDKKSAIQNGLVLNNQFNSKIQKVKFFDELVRAVVDEGTGVVRVGWKFEEEEVMVPDIQILPVQDPQGIQQLQQIMQQLQDPEAAQQMMAQMPPEMQQAIQMTQQTGIPHMPQQVGMKAEMQTTANHPTLEICSYNNIMIDPTCEGDLEEASFAIYSFESNLATLEKDGKYSNLNKIQVEDNNILSAADHTVENESSFNFSDKPRKKFVVYEYWGLWDIEGNGTVKPIVAAWVGNTMIRLEENPFPDKQIPFVAIQYLPVRKSIYGEPDGELLEENQKVIGAVTRGMIDIMARSANGQTGTRKDALDVTNKRKYDRGQDYEFNPQVDPNQAFHMHTWPEIPQSAGLMLQMQNGEAESISGVKAFAGTGITGASVGESATGVRSALDAVSKRELGILRRIAEGVKQIGRKMIAMNAEFLDETEVVRITNEEFVEVKRDDLAGEVDLTLTISTPEADNDKAQELSFMLQTMGPNGDPGMSRLIQANIARLRKMPELAKAIESYQPPPPDPLQVEMQKLEVEKLKMEIAKLQSETVENQANAALDQAKSQETLAKTRLLGSNADKQDLDFVEQEGGVTQQRDLQKAQAQAKGNMALEAQKHRNSLEQRANDSVFKQEEERNKPAKAGSK